VSSFATRWSSWASRSCRRLGRSGPRGGEVPSVSSKPRPRAAVVSVSAPSWALRLLPTGRSVVTGLVLGAVAVLAYFGARESSVFAVDTIAVRGVDGELAADVRAALRPVQGESLLAVRLSDVERLATALPQVASVEYDRAFPHTLVVTVRPEEPLAVLRRGRDSLLVSRRGRIVERLERRARPALPRIWLPRSVDTRVGGTLAAGGGAQEVAALAPIARAGFEGRVATVRIDGSQVVYVLRGGVELRVGTTANLPLKLEIARRILAGSVDAGYLDISVPERPVAGTESQLSG
jgi:cell division protein FtsQ